MTSTALRTLITEAVELDREIREKEKRLKELEARLKAEANTREDEHTETEGGGWSWTAEGHNGCVARITSAAAKLKGEIPEKEVHRIQNIAGKHFFRLFVQAPAYKRIESDPEKFRSETMSLLGAVGKQIIKLLTGTRSVSVSYETKKPEDA